MGLWGYGDMRLFGYGVIGYGVMGLKLFENEGISVSNLLRPFEPSTKVGVPSTN